MRMGSSKAEWSPADADTLGRVLSRLREIERLSGWSRTNAIGELILSSFFNGSVQGWRSRARNKSGSLRRLAAHSDCPLRKSGLSDAVNCYLFYRGNPRVSELQCITPGHATIALRAGEAKALGLLEEADIGQWSIRQLAAQVRLDQQLGGVPIEAFTSLHRVERRFARITTALSKLCVGEPFTASEFAASLENIRDRLLTISELIAPIERSECTSALRSEIVGLRDKVASRF
jgi:hypothetical protein